MARQQQNRNRRSQRKLRLEVTEKKTEENQWRLIAVATVSEGRYTKPGIGVRFYLDGLPVENLQTTDGEGRALVFIDAEPGLHIIKVKTTGETLESIRTVDLPKDKKPQHALELEVSWHKMDSVWRLTSVATVTDGRHPVPNVSVLFYRDGEHFDNASTDAEGRVLAVCTAEPGLHIVKALISGTTFGSKREINLPSLSPEVKPPKKLAVRSIGTNGQYRLLVSVFDEDDKGVSGVEVHFLNEADGQFICEHQTTDNSGTVDPEVTINTNHVVNVIVPGTSLQNKLRLYTT